MRRPHVLVLVLLVALFANVTPGATARADVVNVDRDRFVTLWDTRFHQEEAMQAYLDSDAVYDDGYNDRPEPEKRALVDALVAYWEANEPGFRDHIDYSISDDEAVATRPPVEGDEFRDHVDEKRLPSRAWFLALVYRIVFDKAAFKQDLRADGDERDDGKTGLPDPTQPPTSGTADAMAQIDAALRDAEEIYDAHRPVETGDPIPVPVFQQPDTGALPPPGTTRLPLLARRPQRRGAGPVLARRGRTPQGAMYTACAQQSGQPAPQCVTGQVGGTLGNPLAPPVDVNGVRIMFQVDPIGSATNPTQITGRLTVSLLPGGSPATHAWIYYDVSPGTFVHLGFGGGDTPASSYTPLLPYQQLAAGIDIVEMNAGVVDVSADVTHTTLPAAGALAVEAGYTTAPLAADPVLGRATLKNAPPQLGVGFCQATFTATTLQACGLVSGVTVAPNTAVTLLKVTHPVLTPNPDVTAYVHAVAPLRDVVATAAFANVPPSVQAKLVTAPSSNATITYDATGTVGRVASQVRVVTNPQVDPSYWQANAQLATLPPHLVATYEPLHVGLAASQPVTAAGSDGFAAAYEAGIPGNPDTVQRQGRLTLSNLPTAIDLTLPPKAGTTPPQPRVYTLTTNAVVDAVSGRFADTAQLIDVHGDLEHLPSGTSSLEIPAGANRRLRWQSPPSITHLAAGGRVGAWQFAATVDDVPTSLTVETFGNEVVADATAAGAGSTVQGWMTNVNQIPTAPGYANYLVADVTQPPTGDPQVSAAVKVTNLKHLSVKTADPATYSLEAGGGGDFYAWGRFDNQQTGKRGLATGVVSPFPGKITATVGSVTDVVVSTHVDLTAYAEYGSPSSLAQLPAVPSLHGLAARDGGPANDPARAWRLYVTGLPTHLHLAPTQVLFTDFQPSVNRLQADVVYDSDPNNVLTAYLDLQNVPTGSASSLSGQWSAQKTTAKRTTTASLTATAPMGPLYVHAGGATYGGYAEVPTLPASMSLVAENYQGVSTIAWQASDPIAMVRAGAQARSSAAAPFAVHAAVQVTDVPKQFTVTLARDGAGAGPLFSYVNPDPVAPAQRIDVHAAVDGFLQTPNATLGAELYFDLVDIGTSSSLAKVNGALALSSSGIARISATVSTYFSGGLSGGNEWNLWAVRFGYSYQVGVATSASLFTIEFDDVTSLTIRPSFATKVEGSFSAFRFHWASWPYSVAAQGSVYVKFWIVKWWKFDIVTLSPAVSGSINAFQVFAPTGETEVWTSVKVFGHQLHVTSRPKHVATAVAGLANGANLPGTPGATTTYWVTPSLWYPNGEKRTTALTGLAVNGTSAFSWYKT